MHLQKARVVKYKSNEVKIPDKFLEGPSPKPVVLKPVPFASSPVPEYKKCFAVTIDNVLSPEECAQLKQLAEQSALPAAEGDPDQSVWRPATVSLAPGLEASAPGYRESDRIVWDSQEITDRLWARCCQAEGLKDQLAVMSHRSGQNPGRWEFSRINKRMRFLKYSPGQYFRPSAHCDGPYYYEEDGTRFETQYTFHLYLNDSAEISPESELEGGATSFLSWDKQRRIDVNPKAGSVLVFQHKGLLHAGNEVLKGEKFTVRTDLLYKWVEDKTPDAA
ncbi:unnamed protein product [Clonostachys solani]|uniref:Prolyl 4-hydroxylase alpha subunit domain-containing protein n=1 Tax=Clonostachys solani TaxID=160281 RepID=A0A9N9VTZ0_9HYPO|nr:unnamed protein product [Clonostachys solani]